MTSRIRMTILETITALVVAAIAATAMAVPAQTSATLELRVVDAKTGEPLAGAVVTLSRDGDSVAPIAAQADAEGLVSFAGLAAGRFTADVAFPGYARTRLEAIRVAAGERAKVPVGMVASLNETVIVVNTRPTVELEATSPSNRFSGDFLENLPVPGRSFQSMLTFAPGVQDPDGDGNPNVHGARERDFKVQVGEVSNQDPFTGLYLGYINPDTIEELEVFAIGAGADYGRAQGGFARVVQKQGSNDFEGVFSTIFRTSKLDGNGASNKPDESVPDFEWFQPAFQITGPIVRDHLWFRFSHEYQSIDEPIDTIGAIAVTTHRQTIADDQLTWQITPRHKLSIRYLFDPFTDDNVNVSSIIPPEASVRDEFGGKTWVATFTATPSSRFLFDGQLSYQDYRINKVASQPGVSNSCVFGIAAVESAQCLDAGSGNYSGSYNIDYRDDRQRLTVAGKTTVFFPNARGGSHQLRAGFGAENERFFRETENRPFVNFTVIEGQPIIIPGQPTVRNDIGQASVTFTLPPVSEQRGTSTSWSLWVEDQWKPSSSVVVTLGLRYDLGQVSAMGWEPFDPEQENREWQENRTGNPNVDRILLQNTFTAYEGLPGLVQGLSNALGFPISLTASSIQGQFWSKTRRPMNLDLRDGGLAPRLAVSWDPGGNGKTKLALNVGRYYDKTFLAIPVVESDAPTVSLLYTAERADDGRWFIDDPTGAINPALFVRTVRRDLRIPYSDEYALTFEREIAPETMIRLVGIRRRFEDQFQDIDRNRAPGDYGRCVRQTDPRFQPTLTPSPGSGFIVYDPNTGVSYTDTDPGGGDGRIDDCTGRLEPTGATGPSGNPVVVGRPDGVADLYLQNPAWGTVLEVGNFNSARYSGVVLELVRRLHKNWEMEASYTWSRAVGEAEDFLQSLGNDRSILDDESGYLSYDQRHVVKVNAAVLTPWSFRLGGALSWQSGLPYSVLSTQQSLSSITPELVGLAAPDPLPRTVYPTGSRNDQRNRSYWNLDLRAKREFNLKGGVNLGLTAEIFNVLNDGTYIIYNQALKSGRRQDGIDEAYRRYGRQYQLGFRLAF